MDPTSINLKLTSLFSKGPLCLYNKQYDKWLLADMEFLLSCSTRNLTSLLRSLVFYRVENSKKFHIHAHPGLFSRDIDEMPE